MKKITFLSLALLTLGACGGEKTATTGGDSASTSSSAAPTPDPVASAPAPTIIFTGMMNNEEWKGGPMSVSEQYFAKGSKMLKKTEPFLALVFVSAVEGDTRQILMYVDNFIPKPGAVPAGQIEINVSGVDNDEQKTNYFASTKKDDPKTMINLVITKWESVSESQAIVSGTLSFKAPGSLGAPGVNVENGVFTDVKINVDQTGM